MFYKKVQLMTEKSVILPELTGKNTFILLTIVIDR